MYFMLTKFWNSYNYCFYQYAASSGLFQMFQQAFVALPNSAQVFDLVSKYEQVVAIVYYF